MANRKTYSVNTQRAKETKQRLQEESQKNLLPMWKIPEGETRIRILPPWSETGDIAFESRSHWKIPPNDKMYNCLTVINKECPICELVKEFRQKGKHDIANKFSSKKSIYYNIIVRGEEDKGVQIMRSGVQLYENILSYLYDDEYGDITNTDTGRDITIERSGQGLDTSYNLKVSPKESPLSSNKTQLQSWLNNMFDLDEIMDFKDMLELQSAVEGITGTKSEKVVEPDLVETSATVVQDNTEEVENENVDAEAKKAKLLAELEALTG